MAFEATKCVVLNATYEPITVISSKRALVMFLEGKAIIVEEHPELVVRSPKQTFPVPLMIALKNYIKGRRVFRTKALLTQRNLFVRDAYTCQYCGRKRSELKSNEFMTRDHVIPMAKGGRDIWTNVVTSCNNCNNKKSDYLLEDLNMELLRLPTEPTVFEIWTRQQHKYYSNKEIKSTMQVA
jgi:5-methylcytosine-specific restriction endonuclease McrA